MFIYYFVLELTANRGKDIGEIKQIVSYVKRKIPDVEGDTKGIKKDVKFLIEETKEMRIDIRVNAKKVPGEFYKLVSIWY